MLLEGLLIAKCSVACGISRGENTFFAFEQPRE